MTEATHITGGVTLKPGDIVFYNHPGDKTGKYPPKQSPAMILAVHDDDTVDLRVFTQPSWDGEKLISDGGQIENYRLPEGEIGVPFTWSRGYRGPVV